MSQATTTNTPNHRSDDTLENKISALIRQGEQLAAQLFEAHRKRAFCRAAVNPPAWQIREQIQCVEEQLELALSEWESRHI